jgi:hypothetical protein
MADCDGALRLRFKFRTRRPCDSPISSGDYKRILPARRMKGLESVPDPRSAEELWPDPQPRGKTRRERTAGTRGTGECCLFIAGQPPVAALNSRAKSVAVPFVGAAATLVVAEAIRLLHGSPAYADIKLALSDLGRRHASMTRNYGARDLAGLNYSDACVS